MTTALKAFGLLGVALLAVIVYLLTIYFALAPMVYVGLILTAVLFVVMIDLCSGRTD